MEASSESFGLLLAGNPAKLWEFLQTSVAQAETQVRVNMLLVPLGNVLNFPHELVDLALSDFLPYLGEAEGKEGKKRALHTFYLQST